MIRSVYRTRAGRTVAVFLTTFLDILIDGRADGAREGRGPKVEPLRKRTR